MVEIALSLAIIGFALVAIVGILPIGLGMQKQNDHEWEMASYLYAEALRQVGRRTDFWVRGDYSTSGFTRRSNIAAGYRAWTVAGGILFRLGDRRPEPEKAQEPSLPEPRPVRLMPPANP